MDVIQTLGVRLGEEGEEGEEGEGRGGVEEDR